MSPARARRTPVPAADPAPTSSSALDTLTGARGRATHGDIPVTLIDPDPRNPEHRSIAIDDDFAAAIAADGVITPVLVRPNTDQPGRWWLIAGHRRVAHAIHVGLEVVPATMMPELTDLKALRTLLIENVHREDLRFSEEAQLVQGLLDLGVPESDLTREVHRSASWVRSRRQVARLPKDVQERLDGRQITLGQVERVDEYADHPRIYERLVAVLGTQELEWRLADAAAEVKAEAAIARVREQLAKAGVKIQKKHVEIYGADPTHDRVGGLGPGVRAKTGSPATSAKAFKALVAEHGDALRAVDHGGESYAPWFELVVPHRPDPEETPEELEAAAAAEAAAQAARDELLEAGAAAQVAHDLRTAFLVSVLKGERRLSVDNVAELASIGIRQALASSSWDDRLQSHAQWLIHAKLMAHPFEQSDLERAFAALPAGAAPLLVLARSVEGHFPDQAPSAQLGGASWRAGFRTYIATTQTRTWHTPVGWYALLTRLGYEASPAELDALARGEREE